MPIQTKIVNLEPKSEPESKEPKEKMLLISEKAVNQLLNTIGELPGLTWKITNPLIVFIKQNVTPFKE